jgi:ferrous iron transport protein A
MNLLDAPEGAIVKIRRILAGRRLLLRLSELGLLEGSDILVFRNKGGPVIIRVYGSTLAIGRGQARRIEVAECSA